ncbi:MAG: hypothetical protein ACR2N2_03060, partial [Acidimicrobiia bacterium]
MSYGEKSAWGYIVAAIVAAGSYSIWVIPQIAADTQDVVYVPAMIVSIVLAVVVIVVVQIIIAGRAPTEAGVEDERDTLISHRGDRVGAAVLSA